VVDLKKKKIEIEAFLKEFKRHWDKRVLGDREKNDEALVTLGIKPGHRAEEIKTLKYTDYISGPVQNRNIPKEKVWEFCKKVKGVEVYIKISTSENAIGKRYWTCWSFHPPESPVKYLFKKEDK